MVVALLILALIVGFYVAWNIGANDVANAVGTSVGSGSLSLKQAVVIAAIFEFSGAFLLGANVSETLESGIVNPALFSKDLAVYVYGMLGSLMATGLWLQVASYFGWPVSTTHSIVGAVLGFGVVLGGFQAIFWGQIGSIAASWVISPVLGGVISYLIFSIIRSHILYQMHPVLAAKRLTPWFVFALFFILTLIILFNGLGGLYFELNLVGLFTIATATGTVAALIAHCCVRRVRASQSDAFLETSGAYEAVERIFMYLQIIIACFMAFAHGSNDVANVIGPLSGIVNVLTGKSVIGQSVPVWLLLLGGVGIVVGLATWGWRVIETIGKKITQLTPSRGFAAGFGATITIVLASKLGLPISTTHVLVGSVLGVGFARGIGAINLDTTRDIFISWLVTVPIGAILSVLFFFLIKYSFQFIY